MLRVLRRGSEGQSSDAAAAAPHFGYMDRLTWRATWLPTTTGRDIGARRAVMDTLFAGCGCGINSARTDLCVDMASNNRHAKSIQISHQSMPQKDFSDIFVLYVSFVLLLF